jgi:hypothetical protein
MRARSAIFARAQLYVRSQADAKGKAACKPLTGRAAARVMHGLQSPAFPWKEWHGHSCWGQHADTDFDAVRALACEAIETARRRRLTLAQSSGRRGRQAA